MKVKFMEKCTQSILGNCVFKWAVRTSVRLWCHSHFPSATPTNMAMIRGPATTDSCCVSVQGLHPSTASPSETLLTSSAVVKCDGRAFGAFPGCLTRCFTLTSQFLPPGPRKWRSTPRDVAIFSLSFCFFGRAKNLGICEATKDHSGASSKNRSKEGASGGAFRLEQLRVVM